MRRIRAWFLRLSGLVNKERRDREFAEEVESHLQMHIADNLRSGMTPEEARREALMKLGGIELTRELYRHRRGIPGLEALIQDLHYGLRTMRKNAGFTAVGVLTLALGIGANTAIFSLLDAVMLRQLPVRHPEQLVFLHWTASKRATWQGGYSGFTGCDAESLGAASAGCSFPYPVFELFRSKASSFDGVFAFAGPAGVHAQIRGAIAPASAAVVSGEFFTTLGVSPHWGRLLDSRDDQPGAEPVAVLSYAWWQKNFGGDPGVLGKTVALNGAPFAIAGIAPREFFGLQPIAIPDLWIPVHSGSRLGPGWWNSLDGRSAWLFCIGRLKPRVRLEQGRAELEVLFRQGLAADPQHGLKSDAQPGIALTSAGRGLAGLRMRYSRPLQVLMVVVGLVLLIACANIANLLLARASARRREIAVRLAIGAGRGRLVRQLLTESLLLASMGGTVGLLLAVWASHALAAFMRSGLNWGGALIDVRPNPILFGFTAAVAGLSAVLFGLAPAVTGTRVDPGAALKSSGASAAAALGLRSRLGQFLVAGEMAAAVVLLIGAGLFLRTLVNLQTLDPGFRKDHLLTFTVSPKREGKKVEDQPALSQELQARLAALPGVLSVAWSSDLLLIGNLERRTIRLEGRRDAGEIQVDVLRIGPRFFETMEIPILAGRSIQPEDCRKDARAVWVNRTLAQRYYPNGSPLGDHIPWGRNKGTIEIVGVVGDTKYQTVRSEINPTIYVPTQNGGAFELRTAYDPMSLGGAVQQTVNDVAPSLMVSDIKSQSLLVDQALFTERMMALLSAAFGLLALALAAIGVYGVLAYSVARRTGEIAIRVSLGAMPRDIVQLVLTEGLLLAAIGSAAGLAASYGMTRLLTVFLFGVAALDPLTYAAAALVLLGTAALACYIPARRAMRVEPMAALRCE